MNNKIIKKNKKKKKSFFQKINQLSKIVRILENEIVFHEKRYKDLIELSLNYKKAIDYYGYNPAHDVNDDLKSIYMFSQYHINKCARASIRLEYVLSFIRKHSFSIFVSTKNINGYKSFL